MEKPSKIKIMADIVLRDGKLTMTPHDKNGDLQKAQFVLSYLNEVKKFGKVPVACVYYRVSERDAWRVNAREAYYAYLREFIKRGHENFTNMIVGTTLTQKQDQLHREMKKSFCRLHEGYWVIERDEDTDKEYRRTFSVADDSTLTNEQIYVYFQWAKRELYDLHMDLTKKIGGEAWAPKYWKEDEAA